MTSDIHQGSPGSTALDQEEIEGLIPTHITTRGELNEYEQANILEATRWALSRKHKEILTEQFLRRLHKRMLGKVWRWAGEFRKTGKNIGVEAYMIPVALRDLLEDTKMLIASGRMSWPEIGARFHHRLVSIHLFANGNGRHARLMTDILMKENGQPLFTWGGGSLVEASEVRSNYIRALQSADRGDIKPLMEFATASS